MNHNLDNLELDDLLLFKIPKYKSILIIFELVELYIKFFFKTVITYHYILIKRT